MAYYEVETPDGRIMQIEGPEGVPESQVMAYATSLYRQQQMQPVAEAPAPTAPEEGDFMRGVKSYFPSIQETFGGAQALAGQALGSQGITQAGIERMKKAQAEQKPKETDEFTNAWDKGIGSVLTDWIPYQIGSGVGNIAESVAMAGAGALLGGTLGGGVGAAPGAATGFLSKQLVKKGVKEAAKEIMEKQGKEAAEDYIARNAIGEIESEAAKTLAKQGGKMYGTTAGIAAQAMLHGAGETTSRALQEAGYDPEQLDMSKLVPAIGVHSVADFVSEKILLGGFKGMAGIPEKSTNKFVFDVLKGAAATGAKEIPPEVVQSVAERYGAKMNVGDADAVSEYMNTAAAAFAMSMLPGGVGGARTYLGRPQGMPTPEAGVTPEVTSEAPAPSAMAGTTEGIPPQTEAGREAETIRGMEQGMAMPGMQPAPQEEQPAPQAEQVQPAPIEPAPQPQASEQQPAPEAIVPEPIPSPEPQAIAQEPVVSNWPTDIPTSLFRGYGREDQGAAYGSTVAPIAGRGKYFAFDQQTANEFGPNIETAEAPLTNPYVIRDGDQWRKLTKEAGWPNANPAMMPQEEVESMTNRLQSILKRRGYDGMVVYWDNQSPYDIGPNGENYKTLNNVFGVPQAIVFEPSKKPTKVAPLPEDLHPIEAMSVPGQEQAHKEAVDKAKAAGVNPVLSRLTGRINPEKTTVDWNTIEQFPTVGGLLDHIKDHVPVDYKGIIQKILPTVKNIPLSAVPAIQDRNGKRTGWLGAYRPTLYKDTGDIKSHRIELSVMARGNDISTILHETLHGATTANYYRGKAGDPRYAPAVKDLDSLTRKLIKLQKEGKINIPFFNDYKRANLPRELISWGQTDRDVQRELKSVVLPNKKTAWSEFVNTMRKLLGLPANQTTALEHLMDISERLTSDRDVMETAPVGPAQEEVMTKVRQPEEGPPEPVKEYQRQNILGQQVQVPVRESYTVDEGDKSHWATIVDNFVHDYVDKFVDLKKIIAAINATKRKLDDNWDAYMRETLYHQRVRFQTKEFLANELEPLAREMVARGVTEEELNAYLMARHAEEYNNAINERNPGDSMLQGRGSGIHTMVADAYLKGATKEKLDALRETFARSGLTLTKNEEALLKEIPKMTDAKRKALAELSGRVDKMIRKTQQIAIDGGIEKEATIKYWNDLYQHYVPFKRSPEELEFEQSNTGAGRGYSSKAGIGRAATGSLKTIDNVLSNIITQRDMAIVKSEKARIGRAIYAMFLQHPNPEIALVVNPNAGVIGKANDLFIKIQKDKKQLSELGKTIDAMDAQGKPIKVQLKAYNDLRDKIQKDVERHAELAVQAEKAKQDIIKEMTKFGYDSQNQNIDGDMIENIIREPQGSFYNPNTGMVEYRTNSFLRSSPNVLAVPIDGETRYIFFNTKNPLAQRLGHSLKGADVEQLGRITALVSKFTRWIASVNTQYNPFFGIVNMMRDIQGAQLNLSSTPLAGQQMAVNKNIFPAAAAIWKALRFANSSEFAAMNEEQRAKYIASLGEYGKAWLEFQQRGGTTGIREMLNDNRRQISALSNLLADYNRNPTQATLLKAGKGAIEYMSNFNDTMENAVRLAAFIEAKKKFSKTYANPEVAADKAAELAKNLTVNFNRKGAKTSFVNSLYAFFNASVQGTARLAETLKGPAGKKIMTSLVLLGVIQQLMLEGFDDEDPPEFVRQKNLVIPTGGGKYLSIPMPLGFNLFVNTGRLATSAFMSGGENATKNISKLFAAAADSFSPLGGGSVVQAAAPTVLDPAVALYGNTDAFGRPIFRADRPGQPIPGYLRSTEGATDISRFIAKALNYMSGGTEFQKGEISPTADHIDYIAGQLGGGTYREARKLVEFASNVATGEETAPYRVPLAGRFMGDTGSEANVRNKFYANVQQMASFEQEIKGRLKTQQRVDEFLTEHPEARMYQAANAAESQITKLNKLRKQLIERGASKEQLKQLNDTKIQLMKQLNEAMANATPK